MERAMGRDMRACVKVDVLGGAGREQTGPFCVSMVGTLLYLLLYPQEEEAKNDGKQIVITTTRALADQIEQPLEVQ